MCYRRYRAERGESMNIFRSETAPYFFALTASAIGWFAATIANETNARRIAIHSIAPESAAAGAGTRILIENISRLSTISEARFMFVCADGRYACFAPGAQGQDGPPRYRINAAPPLYLQDVRPEGSQEALLLRVTLVPNSRLDLTLFPQDPEGTKVLFYYVPDGQTPQDILFMEAGGIAAWFLKHYFTLLIVALFVTMGVFLAMVAINLLQFVASLFKAAPGNDPTSKHHVTLRLDDGDRP